jgi:hypothetical protein
MKKKLILNLHLAMMATDGKSKATIVWFNKVNKRNGNCHLKSIVLLEQKE